MYSPSVFSGDFHDLWLQNQLASAPGSSIGGTSVSPSVHRLSHQQHHSGPHGHHDAPGGGGGGHTNTPSHQSASDVSDDQRRQQLAHLFAPPLSAYSVENPGPSFTQLDYIMRTKSLNGHDIPSSNLLTPLVARKLHKLQSISRIGYHTITPVGLNKTMGEMAYDERKAYILREQQQQQQQQQQQSGHHQNPFDRDAAAAAAAQDDNSFIPTVENTNNSILDQPEEVDLDADVPDIDLQSVVDGVGGAAGTGTDSEDEFDFRGPPSAVDSPAATASGSLASAMESGRVRENEYYGNEDDDAVGDGFMAEEVEYQHDHSISTTDMNRTAGTQRSVSGGIVSTSSILSAIQRGTAPGTGPSGPEVTTEDIENDENNNIENENANEPNRSAIDDDSMDMTIE